MPLLNHFLKFSGSPIEENKIIVKPPRKGLYFFALQPFYMNGKAGKSTPSPQKRREKRRQKRERKREKKISA